MMDSIPPSDDVVSIVLTSETRGYGPAPENGDEIEQSIKISSSGFLKIVRVFHEAPEIKFACEIDEESSKKIVKAIVDAMAGPICFGCDMPMWFVDLESNDGRSIQYSGSIDGHDLRSGRFKTSGLIRRILRASPNKMIQSHLSDISELALFDGGE